MRVAEQQGRDLANLPPVLLRGHHFLCILTYRGFGYTPAFVSNMSEIVDAIGGGRRVQLVEGPDDICKGLTQECRKVCDHDCTRPSTLDIDRLAIDAAGHYLPLYAGEAFVLDEEHVSRMREAFAEGAIRAACERCSWKKFCTEIAADGYSGVKLFASA